MTRERTSMERVIHRASFTALLLATCLAAGCSRTSVLLPAFVLILVTIII